MKTLTIEWLNKCRCGNKLHTVKTARGNESALWDDDAVKCDSCGRGGVIQVCEGQARVLWETDEEMVEGKPMSTITKEWLQQKIADMEAIRDDIPFGLGEDGANTLAALRIALASLEADPVCVIDEANLDYLNAGSDADVWPASRKEMGDVLLYRTAPPAPENAEPVAWLWSHRKHPSEVSLVRPEDDERAEGAHWSGWSCQALYAAQQQEVKP
ncbi:hypothetical protein [Enterobacter roggenkampii]|uniref:hypothetical protein n=2 Tax=Enterobacteriaceae TaxID=543 RepID=UPI001D0C2233|nr:hypothetical protein [Enterobacter roggenkampii]MCC1989384.1 hypothetical protein [Enterobacter roggenkampii]MCM7724459.1 hypothetical protein [Enterobacter roggenkampii]HCM9145658.1 hypothetical protein [Enterobacter roggenkampii]